MLLIGNNKKGLNMEASESTNQNEPMDIGGWLLLIGFGIILSPIRLTINLWGVYIPLFSDGTMEDIMVNGSLIFVAIIIIEIIANIFFLLFSIYLIKLFFQKMNTFPKCYFVLALASTSFILIDSLAISLLFPDAEIFDSETVRGMISAAFALFIWSPYLFKSERSKNTFIKQHA